MIRKCPSCGYRGLVEPPGSGETCPMCLRADGNAPRHAVPQFADLPATTDDEAPSTVPPPAGAPDAIPPSGHSPRAPDMTETRWGGRRARLHRLLTDLEGAITREQLRLARRWSPAVAGVLVLVALLAHGWVRGLVGLLAVLALLCVAVVLWVSWWRLGPRRWWLLGGRERQDQLAQMYLDALADSEAAGIALMRVRQVGDRRPQGSRCRVEGPDGGERDAWFWHDRPRRGDVLVVRTAPAPPAESTPLHLVHVGSETTGTGIVYRVPRAAWRAGRSHLARRGSDVSR